jgi:hypothetical protein
MRLPALYGSKTLQKWRKETWKPLLPCELFFLIKRKKDPAALTSHSASLAMLWELGFRSPEKEKRFSKGSKP